MATLCVVFTVLFASIYAPAHATAMAFPSEVERTIPCPMTGQPVTHDHGAAPVEETVSQPGDMTCCPAPALGTEARASSIFRVLMLHDTPHLSDTRCSLVALPVDPGVPRG